MHKSELNKIGCTTGNSTSNILIPPSSETIKKYLEKLNKFRPSLLPSVSMETKWKNELAFMAENGV